MYEEQLRQLRPGSNPLLASYMIQQQKLRKEAALLYIIWKAEILYWTCTWPLKGIKKMQEYRVKIKVNSMIG